MKRRDVRISRSLFALRSYLGFFLLVSFLVTCCFLIFLEGMDVPRELIQERAILTFGNVMFLSLICSLADGVLRRITVARPLNRILYATHQWTQGNFTARIQPFHGFESMNEFDAIIEDFNKMAEELSSIETLRTDFIANVSHELKTPLAVIQNYAAMLQTLYPQGEQGDLSMRQKEYAKAIADASRRLSELITNILKLNKLENQQIFPEPEEYDLDEQLCECMLNFENAWEKKELEIDTDLDPIRVKADPQLLTLVWNNLISNAVKFTGQGGRISVSLKEEGDSVVARISDTGCGISQEVGGRIFEKFYQGDSSHATQGNGLGLALVKRVVDIVGGEIAVESAVGRGTAFIVRLRRDAD